MLRLRQRPPCRAYLLSRRAKGASLTKSGPDPAGRGPCTPVRRRHGMCDACAQGRSKHFPVERTQGAHSAGGAPNSFVYEGASTRLAIMNKAVLALTFAVFLQQIPTGGRIPDRRGFNNSVDDPKLTSLKLKVNRICHAESYLPICRTKKIAVQ